MLSKIDRLVLSYFRKHNSDYIFVDDLQKELPRIDVMRRIEYLYPMYLERSLQGRGDKILGVYRINEAGEAALDEFFRSNLRYNITTGIALIALIKSFMPEITSIVASLSRLLAQ